MTSPASPKRRAATTTATWMSTCSQTRAAPRAPTTTPRLVSAVTVPKMRPRRPSSVVAARRAIPGGLEAGQPATAGDGRRVDQQVRSASREDEAEADHRDASQDRHPPTSGPIGLSGQPRPDEDTAEAEHGEDDADVDRGPAEGAGGEDGVGRDEGAEAGHERQVGEEEDDDRSAALASRRGSRARWPTARLATAAPARRSAVGASDRRIDSVCRLASVAAVPRRRSAAVAGRARRRWPGRSSQPTSRNGMRRSRRRRRAGHRRPARGPSPPPRPRRGCRSRRPVAMGS